MLSLQPKNFTERYDNEHDVSMRLVGSVFVYNSEMVLFVDCVHSVSQVSAIDCMTMKSETFHPNDELFDVNQARLGFCNVFSNNPAVYLAYPPVRSQKSGLSLQSIQGYGVKPFNGLKKGQLTPLAKTILGIFPSIKECAAIDGGGAFSRDYAIVPGSKKGVFSLFYKNSPVGLYLHDRKTFLVPDSRFDKRREMSLVDTINEQGKDGDYAIERLLV